MLKLPALAAFILAATTACSTFSPPGNTKTSVLLRNEVLSVAPEIARAKVRCEYTSYELLNTQVTSDPNRASWSEIWIFGICGQRVTVPIDFKSNGKGGTYFKVLGAKATVSS